MAFEEYARAQIPEPPAEPVNDVPSQTAEEAPSTDTDLPHTSSVAVETGPRMVNKKLQVSLRPPQRTRSHQTDAKLTQTTPVMHTVSTQTDLELPVSALSDESPYASEDEDDAEDSRDADYDPNEDDFR